MERYDEEGDDSDNETDPEQLLNEWLGELDSLTVVSSCKTFTHMEVYPVLVDFGRDRSHLLHRSTFERIDVSETK